jgi:hypothetical protein
MVKRKVRCGISQASLQARGPSARGGDSRSPLILPINATGNRPRNLLSLGDGIGFSSIFAGEIGLTLIVQLFSRRQGRLDDLNDVSARFSIQVRPKAVASGPLDQRLCGSRTSPFSSQGAGGVTWPRWSPTAVTRRTVRRTAESPDLAKATLSARDYSARSKTCAGRSHFWVRICGSRAVAGLGRVEPVQGTTVSAGLPPLPPKGLMPDEDPLKTSLTVPAKPVSAQVGRSPLRNPARRRCTPSRRNPGPWFSDAAFNTHRR